MIDKNQVRYKERVCLKNLSNDIVPVERIERNISCKASHRQFRVKIKQFGLMPAFSITCHKFEGQTSEIGIVILAKGNKRWLYTANSRAKCLKSIYSLYPWTSRTKDSFNNQKSDTIKNFMEEMERLKNIANETQHEVENFLKLK